MSTLAVIELACRDHPERVYSRGLVVDDARRIICPECGHGYRVQERTTFTETWSAEPAITWDELA